MKREEYEERMKDSKYRELAITKCEDEKDYVFISYRGNSWRKVLTEIVYKLQNEYGLRIYFDKEFASETNIWIEQFIKNMDSSHCKACLCFFDEGYVTSYATLLELMHAMNPRSKLGDSIFPVSFPINWKKLDNADWNTGLGVEDQDNPGWEEEKKTFEREFRSIKKRYPAVEDYYYDGAVLRGCDCKDIMAIIQPKNKREYANEEAYYKQFIVDPLKKKCPEVFEETGEIVKYNVVITNDDIKSTLWVKDGDLIPKQNPGIREGFEFEGWFVFGTDEEWDFADSVNEDIEIYARWEDVSTPPPTSTEGYKYTIFGDEYEAGSREQGKLMFDAFEALVKRYPECAEQLTQRTSIARAEDVKNANTQEADPTYFRGCKSFNVDGKEYLVGTSYGYKAKIAEIKGMFKICGVDSKEFVLNGEPLKPGRARGKKTGKESGKNDDVFEYELWGIPHTANKMVDMMNDVFDLIAEKFFDKIEDIVNSDDITAVARKDDIDKGKIHGRKAKQFAHYKGREHSANGNAYYVNAGYNREDAVKQIARMLVLCEGDSGGFKMISAPEKSTHNGNKSGKKTLRDEGLI